jgi:hypothetical protein
MRTTWTVALTLTLPALVACGDDGGASASDTDATTGDTSGGTEPTTGTPDNCEGIVVPMIDESSCQPEATDYQPRVDNSADDMWPACVADIGPYPLVEGTPSAQARIEAYEMMAGFLWRKSKPTSEDFTKARDQYVIAEGLESRVARREDLHEDPIPMAEWDPQVDPDKQCTITALVTKYPARCVGPSTISPIIEDAFMQGQMGQGDPDVHAARIHAALDWFLQLSTYKEANTCATVAAKDCDAAWAYYTGGATIDGGIGWSAEVRAASPSTHERIHDGLMAVRCWRDLNQDGMGGYPLLDTLPQDAVDQFNVGWEQLDQALHRGLAVTVRDQMSKFIDAACAGQTRTQIWNYLTVAGQGLQGEADRRNATEAKVLADLWAMDAPTAADVAAGITALDAIFPCP